MQAEGHATLHSLAQHAHETGTACILSWKSTTNKGGLFSSMMCARSKMLQADDTSLAAFIQDDGASRGCLRSWHLWAAVLLLLWH